MCRESALFVAHLNNSLRANDTVAIIRGTSRNIRLLRVLVRDGFVLGFTPDVRIGFVKVFFRVNNQTGGLFRKLTQVSVPTNTAVVKSIKSADPSVVVYYSVLGGLRLGRLVLGDISGGMCCFRLRC